MSNRLKTSLWVTAVAGLLTVWMTQWSQTRTAQRQAERAFEMSIQNQRTLHRIRQEMIRHGGFEYVPYGEEE